MSVEELGLLMGALVLLCPGTLISLSSWLASISPGYNCKSFLSSGSNAGWMFQGGQRGVTVCLRHVSSKVHLWLSCFEFTT